MIISVLILNQIGKLILGIIGFLKITAIFKKII